MPNTYFAIALVGAQSVGVAIRAENIDMAFEVAEQYLQEHHPRSDVIVHAVQPVTDPSIAAVTPSKVMETDT